MHLRIAGPHGHPRDADERHDPPMDQPYPTIPDLDLPHRLRRPCPPPPPRPEPAATIRARDAQARRTRQGPGMNLDALWHGGLAAPSRRGAARSPRLATASAWAGLLRLLNRRDLAALGPALGLAVGWAVTLGLPFASPRQLAERLPLLALAGFGAGPPPDPPRRRRALRARARRRAAPRRGRLVAGGRADDGRDLRPALVPLLALGAAAAVASLELRSPLRAPWPSPWRSPRCGSRDPPVPGPSWPRRAWLPRSAGFPAGAPWTAAMRCRWRSPSPASRRTGAGPRRRRRLDRGRVTLRRAGPGSAAGGAHRQQHGGARHRLGGRRRRAVADHVVARRAVMAACGTAPPAPNVACRSAAARARLFVRPARWQVSQRRLVVWPGRAQDGAPRPGRSTRTAVMLEATLAQRMGLVALIAAAAIGTTWIVLPEAFPSLRQRRPSSEHSGRPFRGGGARPDCATARRPRSRAARTRPGSTSPGSAPAACW